MAIAAIPSVTGTLRSRWPDPAVHEPVATAPPPRARRSRSADGADPIDVDVLWEELDAAAPPARPRWRPYIFGGVVPLAPPDAVVHDAYATSMRRPARAPRVDLLAV